jgi:hypothetical protein
MVDLVVTPANVVAGTNAKVEHGIAGATIAAGQTVYKDSATKRYLLADADSATPDARFSLGVALNGAANGQPLAIVTGGNVNPGAVVAVGTVYVQSDTPGGIMPAADLETGDYVTILGVGTTASNIALGIMVSGVAVP